MKITKEQIENIEIGGVDTKDYPDFCDAFIEYCEIDGREANEDEVEWIQDNYPELVLDAALEYCVGMSE